MIVAEPGLRALFGGPLHVGPLVRLIYMDESGTAPNARVAVVAAAIIHGDEQGLAAEADHRALLEKHVPEAQREGFVFHATEMLYGSKRVDKETWPYDDRRAAVEDVLGMARRLNIPVAFAYVRRVPGDDYRVAHMVAFGMCVSAVDRYLETFCGNEVGILFAEDTQEMKKRLKGVVAALKNPKQIPPELSGILQATRIKGPLNFLAKDEEPMLQLADHASYALRLALTGEPLGTELLAHLHDLRPDDKRLAGPNGSGVAAFLRTY